MAEFNRRLSQQTTPNNIIVFRVDALRVKAKKEETIEGEDRRQKKLIRETLGLLEPCTFGLREPYTHEPLDPRTLGYFDPGTCGFLDPWAVERLEL